MRFEEVIIQDDGFFEDVDWMGHDAFYNYWMDISDPRRTYWKVKEAFDFEQECGGGDY